MRKVTVSLGKIALLGLLLGTSACGKAEDLPNTSLSAALTPPPVQRMSASSQVYDALPKVLLAMEELQQDIRKLRLTPIASAPTSSSPTINPPNSPGTSVSTTPSAPRSSTRPRSSTPTPQAPSAPAPSQPAKPDGNAELQQILNKISGAPFVVADVDKTEKNLTSGKTSTVKIKMYSKKPNLVKLEVLQSSSGAEGAKILYTSNEGNKAKVRPGGAMSFITTELPKTDDRLISGNGYTFDDIDLFSVYNRLSQGYQAELVGRTQVGGQTVNVLKVTTGGSHGMGSHVDYEYFGYDPGTYEIRLWEIYAKGEEQPYYRMLLDLDFPSTLPDSTFKL